MSEELTQEVFVTEPRIELVSQPVLDIAAILRFLEANGQSWPAMQEKDHPLDMGDLDGEWLVELAARLCYMSFGKGRDHEAHIKNLLSVMHGSTMEHSVYTILIWNVSRSLTHELVRHRSGMAYSQLSQRYVDEKDTRFVIPPAIRELGKVDCKALDDWKLYMLRSREFYENLVERLMEFYSGIVDKVERRKKARQAARSVLPNATETKIAVSGNIRSWRWIIQQRASVHADVEIRALAVKICRRLKEVCPLPFFDMNVVSLSDGTEAVESLYHKV